MLIPMNDISKEGLDCNDQVVMGLAGILLTMTIEGILGRRNCLVIYSTLISMAAMFCDLLQRANVNVLTDIEKYENVNIIQHFIRFFADPVNSLVYLMTLSVYPYSLRYRVLRVSRLYELLTNFRERAFTIFWIVREIPDVLSKILWDVVPFYTKHGQLSTMLIRD